MISFLPSPPQVRLWNDTGTKRRYAVFDGTGLVGHLKINRSWTRANGKITYSDPSLIFGISWYGEGRVRAQYSHYVQ